tara:strand:+ start:846 stop:1106 length:261 start_codon:yes stop_codon:yes gene_type:complete
MKNNENTKLSNLVEAALDKVRPYLNADGGDIKLLEITDDLTVKISFTGACVECDASMLTLKNGVETTIKNALPNVKEVVDVTKRDS